MSGWSMRTLACAATIYTCLASLAAHSAPSGTMAAADQPRPLPEIAVMTLEGESGTLAGARAPGKPAVINLWATWCAPCIRELPDLVDLQKKLGDAATVVALSVDRGGMHAVGKFLAKTGVSGLTFRLDPRSDALQALQVRGLPTTLLVDAQGREVARYEGPAEWAGPEMLEQVRGLLKIH